MALSGHFQEAGERPLSGVKRTSCGHRRMSANDPKPTSMTRVGATNCLTMKSSTRCGKSRSSSTAGGVTAIRSGRTPRSATSHQRRRSPCLHSPRAAHTRSALPAKLVSAPVELDHSMKAGQWIWPGVRTRISPLQSMIRAHVSLLGRGPFKAQSSFRPRGLGRARRSPSVFVQDSCDPLLRQRIGSYLDMHGARL